MDEELKEYITKWLELTQSTQYLSIHNRMDNKACHFAAKYLIDEIMPTYAVTSAWELEPVYRMYEHATPAIAEKLDILVGQWKQSLFGDPDLKAAKEMSSIPLDVITVLSPEEELIMAYAGYW